MKTWLDLLPPMFRTPLTSAGQGQDNVRDELMFHFRQLVSEKVTQGASFDEAWDLAERQFGPIRQIEIQCQTVLWRSRVGWSIVAVTAAGLFLVIGWQVILGPPQPTPGDSLTSIQQSLMSSESARQAFEAEVIANLKSSDARFELLQSQIDLPNSRLATGQVVAEAPGTLPSKTLSVPSPDDDRTGVAIEPSKTQLSDLTGRVSDGDEEPIAQAKILVILKTWPSGRYRQDDFLAETDNEGKFVLPELVPIANRYAIQVTVVKEGYALKSHYHLKATPDEALRPVEFRLEPTTPKSLVFQDEDGKPIRQVNVIPSTRISSQGDEFLVYFQGAESIQVTSDADGRVDLAIFSNGDRAELYYQLPGEPWKTQEVAISGEEIVVQIPGRSAPL